MNGFIVLCLVLLSSFFVCASEAKSNRTRGGRVLFPDYPPTALHTTDEPEEKSGELETFQMVEGKIKSMIDDVIKKVLPYVIRSSADIRLSGKCMASIFKLVIGMQKLQEWAIKMVDATGKPPSGVFQGTTMSLGDFDECINVRVGKHGKEPAYGEEEYFHGKYCTIEAKLPKGILTAIDEFENTSPVQRFNTSIGTSKTFLSMLLKYGQYLKVVSFRIGVCMPSFCDVEDLDSISATIAKQAGFPMKVLHCQERTKLQFTTDQTIIVSILSVIALSVIVFTVLDVFFSKYTINPLSKFQNTLRKVSKALSAVENTKKLVDVSTDKHPMPTLRGLFLITVVFNILAHTYLLYNHLFFFKYSSILNYFEFMQQFSFSVIANGSNGVENYFFIAGFLVTYTRWKKSADTPKINLPKLIIKPYVRLVLFQLLVIGLFLLLPLIGYGPFWGDFVGPYLKSCKQSWWLNLLFIQNFWASDYTCLYHTWLLAAVMQLYVISLIVIWFLIKKPNFGVGIIILLITCGMAAVGSIVFIHKFPGALSLYFLDGITGPKMWNTLFIQTFDHIGPFCIALVTGYLVAKHKKKLIFGRLVTTLIWCAVSACFLAITFGLYEYRYGGIKMDPSVSIIYAMLNRNIYGLCLAWFVIACVTDKAGYMPDLLSWKALIPAYRLSYLAYLLHLVIIYYHVGILRERMYLSHEENIINYFGYLVSTYILSYVCYIFFQVPYMYLESVILKKKDRSEDDSDSDKDVEKDLKKFSDSKICTKNIKRQMEKISISSLKDCTVLGGANSKQDRDSQ